MQELVEYGLNSLVTEVLQLFLTFTVCLFGVNSLKSGLHALVLSIGLKRL